ncbi:hypothetical protein B0H17DRAFT_1255937, partial [Mycena rosella]
PTKSQVASNASVLSHSTSSVSDKRWNSDSGATSHMTHCRELLLHAHLHKVPIPIANGVVVYSELVGKILLRPLLVHGQIRRPIYLTNGLYVPLLSHNLISTTYLSQVHRYSILMNEHTILFKQSPPV